MWQSPAVFSPRQTPGFLKDLSHSPPAISALRRHRDHQITPSYHPTRQGRGIVKLRVLDHSSTNPSGGEEGIMNDTRVLGTMKERQLLFRRLGVLIILAGGTFVMTPISSATATESTNHQVDAAYGKLPLYFEANRGQTDEQVKFLSRGAHHNFFLTSNDVVLVMTHLEPATRNKL